MRVEPFEPPRLWTTPGREALWNALLSQAGAVLPLTKGAAARFTPCPPPAPHSWALSALPERAPHLIVVIESYPFQALFGAGLTAADLPNLPPAVHGALAEGIVASVRDVLPRALVGDIRVLGFGASGDLAGRAEPAGIEWFRVEIGGLAAEPVELTVGCARDALLASLLAVEPVPRPVWSGLASRLTEPVFYTLGALALTRDEIRTALVRGAVAVFPAAPEEETRLRTSAALYRFARTEAGWQCRGREPLAQGRLRPGLSPTDPARETAMPPDDTPQPFASPALQLSVDFDLGSVAVPLAELESWQPGAVVPLDPPVPGRGLEVTIRVNGYVIGSGDLVTIDERPAVRIARLALDA